MTYSLATNAQVATSLPCSHQADNKMRSTLRSSRRYFKLPPLCRAKQLPRNLCQSIHDKRNVCHHSITIEESRCNLISLDQDHSVKIPPATQVRCVHIACSRLTVASLLQVVNRLDASRLSRLFVHKLWASCSKSDFHRHDTYSMKPTRLMQLDDD